MNRNPQDYARNSSAQLVWARELISRMSFVGSEPVLEVGCGDGKITAEFARGCPGGHVLGVDSSPEFIAYASLHHPKALFSSLQFEVTDARSLNINNRFDLVFSRCTGLTTIRFSSWRGEASLYRGTAGSFVRWSGQRIWDYCSAGDDLVFGLAALLRWFSLSLSFYSPDDYSAWLPEANLTAVRCELVEKDMIHDGPEGLSGWIRTTWFAIQGHIDFARQFVVEQVPLGDTTPADGRRHTRERRPLPGSGKERPGSQLCAGPRRSSITCDAAGCPVRGPALGAADSVDDRRRYTAGRRPP
jgi:trans-aconitate 2-methyltransferase